MEIQSSPEYFISYRFTWVPIEELKYKLSIMVDAVLSLWRGVFCSLDHEEHFREKWMTSDEIYAFCLDKMKESRYFVAFIDSEIPSSGMRMELEKVEELGMKVVLIIKKWLQFDNFRAVADFTFEFDNIEEIPDFLASFILG